MSEYNEKKTDIIMITILMVSVPILFCKPFALFWRCCLLVANLMGMEV